MRCNDCNRFVSHELHDDFQPSVDVDASSYVVNVSLTFTLNCMECGGELATTESEGSFDFPQDLIDHLESIEEGKEGEHELTCDDGEIESGDYYQDKPRKLKNGEVIHTPFRYQKHFYTADWSSTINCSCGETFDISGQIEAQASDFQQY